MNIKKAITIIITAAVMAYTGNAARTTGDAIPPELKARLNVELADAVAEAHAVADGRAWRCTAPDFDEDSFYYVFAAPELDPQDYEGIGCDDDGVMTLATMRRYLMDMDDTRYETLEISGDQVCVSDANGTVICAPLTGKTAELVDETYAEMRAEIAARFNALKAGAK